MGGEFARRVWEKSEHRKKDDVLFCHLDGSQFTRTKFWKLVNKMTFFTKETERTGKKFQPYSLRHFYVTTRLQEPTCGC